MSEFAPNANFQGVSFGVTNDANLTPTAFRMDPITKRLLVSATYGGSVSAVYSTGGSASNSGNNTLIAADASNKIKVKAFSLTTLANTAVTCIFQDGAGGSELWRVVLLAPTTGMAGANLSVPAPDWLFATSANTLLNLNLSAAQIVNWSVSYFLDS